MILTLLLFKISIFMFAAQKDKVIKGTQLNVNTHVYKTVQLKTL